MRGYDYYCEGRVKSVFNINGIEWMAIVQGYDDHVVQLNIMNDSLLRYECNCSDTEDPCKHVIAVLYYIKNEAHKLKNRMQRVMMK
ncbi:MAG: SWIM zinc finger family protein [Bacteroidetes bacterium]|nr:SWIM zinc finger family protein [Bacteroidota bacterium]